MTTAWITGTTGAWGGAFARAALARISTSNSVPTSHA